MRKLFGIMIVSIGALIIGVGVFLQFNNNNTKLEETKQNEQEKIGFQRINIFNVNETCSTYQPVSTYINTSDYTKISFNYPNCTNEYNLSFWSKHLQSDDKNIILDISVEKTTLNSYINKIKTKLISYKNDESYQDLTYTETGEIITKNDIKVNIIEANYKLNLITSTKPFDLWYVAAEISDNQILKFEIISKENVISYKAIEELFNNIKIEVDSAKFTNSTKKDNYQIGTIKQNIKNSHEHGYKVNYTVTDKYLEVDSFSSNYDQSVFEYEDINKTVYASISLENDSYKQSALEEIESYKKNSISTYEENKESYRNNRDSGIQKKIINNKEVYYFVYSYDYYYEGVKSSTNYISYTYYEITPGFYYIIYISNKNEEITESLISKFLNITIEEY